MMIKEECRLVNVCMCVCMGICLLMLLPLFVAWSWSHMWETAWRVTPSRGLWSPEGKLSPTETQQLWSECSGLSECYSWCTVRAVWFHMQWLLWKHDNTELYKTQVQYCPRWYFSCHTLPQVPTEKLHMYVKQETKSIVNTTEWDVCYIVVHILWLCCSAFLFLLLSCLIRSAESYQL